MHIELQLTIDNAIAACTLAHKVRHTIIAHRNADVAMKRKPVPEASRADVRKAIDALDEVFNFVHTKYTDEGPMMWEHLDALGGSEHLLWLVRRALKARDDDFEKHLAPMKFRE
jgi:hypothetical protein